jgi:8-oxo-dGTP pyrophosphatase MutT (NUDIX family)
MSTEVWRPSVTVAAVIERDGRFLFVEELIDGRHVLNQPAGHLDPGESLVAACTREVVEETAHEFTPRHLVGIYRWKYEAKDVTFLRFCFSGKVSSFDEKRKLDKEIVALHWLTVDELRKRSGEHRSPLVQQCVDDYLAGKRYPLEVLSGAFA